MKNLKQNKTILLIIFLLGIFVGALDSGIVSPARTVIANSFSISTNSSIWIITIYTLAYAVSMPIAGKLSDRYGKIKIFRISILLFGIGSLLCGISNYAGSYELLLFARVIQAIGGGGIMPIATAYIGEMFPIEKRGSALGLVGAIYGISTTLGPTAGSFIMDTFGASNWGLLFFINVPICIAIILVSLVIKDTASKHIPKKMDILGSILASATILSLMYSLTNLQFHDFLNSIKSTNVYPFIIAFIVILPIFIMVEKRAEDPIINLHYFTEKQIAITLILSFIVGAGMMGIVFVPQFGENILRIKTGSGGYLVTLMAIFSGIAAPFGGKLIDKYSAKFILILGFCSTIIGSLVLALLSPVYPTLTVLVIGLFFIGLGMGFSMGTPLNYLMQSYVSQSETASAQSTLSLVRSIGVAISPNILVNFIASAGSSVPQKLQSVMPTLNIPGVSTQNMASMFSGGNASDMIATFQNADVTTIFGTIKDFSANMFDKFAPMIKQNLAHAKLPNGMTPDILINSSKTEYLNSLENSRTVIENTFMQTMNSGFKNLFIASAIIALLGLIFTLMLSNKKKNTSN